MSDERDWNFDLRVSPAWSFASTFGLSPRRESEYEFGDASVPEGTTTW